MLAHFQNTCNPHTVKSTEVRSDSAVAKLRKHGSWEFVEFRNKTDNTTQCKYRWRVKVIEGEEAFHVVWYKGLDGKIYIVENIDITKLPKSK